MVKRVLSVLALTGVASVCLAQVGGGSVYRDGQNGNPQANERAKRNVAKDDMPTGTGMYVDASILINVVADEYVALFGISEEGATLEESNQKMSATIAKFTGELKSLGVKDADLDIDFIAQNRIYGFEVAGDLAKEKLVGFETKKNVAIHYKDRAMLDKLIAAAGRSQIFDLVKVDYVVRDIAAVRAKLMEYATRVVKQKAATHERLLGIKFRQPQLIAERYSSYYPTEQYASYAAFESEDVQSNYYRQKYTVQGARKNRTFYFDPLSAAGFDHVVNPIVVEPVVQFTVYLKVKYETAPVPSKPKNSK